LKRGNLKMKKKILGIITVATVTLSGVAMVSAEEVKNENKTEVVAYDPGTGGLEPTAKVDPGTGGL
jgi:ABC-type transporter Mla subunit MlaD